MRWKLLLRRLSVSAPHVNVRSDLPWPLRWAVIALVFGFCAAIGLWAFEFGRDIAGLDRHARQELGALQAEVERLQEEAAQNRLAQQLKQAEADAMTLRADLGFFEKLLPASGDGLSVRAVQVEPQGPGQMRYQMLVMQSGKGSAEFRGRYALTLTGTLDGRDWTHVSDDARPLTVKQYARIEGTISHPARAVVQTVQVRVNDNSGGVRATQTVRL
jgi:hypothetical protein